MDDEIIKSLDEALKVFDENDEGFYRLWASIDGFEAEIIDIEGLAESDPEYVVVATYALEPDYRRGRAKSLVREHIRALAEALMNAMPAWRKGKKMDLFGHQGCGAVKNPPKKLSLTFSLTRYSVCPFCTAKKCKKVVFFDNDAQWKKYLAKVREEEAAAAEAEALRQQELANQRKQKSVERINRSIFGGSGKVARRP